jgi:hypothetical protein
MSRSRHSILAQFCSPLFRRMAWPAALVLCTAAAAIHGRELRLELAIDRPSTFQVFYASEERGFTEENSARAVLVGDNAFHELVFPLPDWDPLNLRLDPACEPAHLRIRNIRLFSADGVRLGEIRPSAVLALQQAKVTAAAGEIAVDVPAGCSDPILLVDGGALRRLLHPHEQVRRAGFVVAAALLGLIAVAVVGLGARACLAPVASTRRLQLIVAAGAALFVLGARLALMKDRVSWAPYLDQYEGELATVIAPFESGALRWSDFIAPHNDHRIATTRVACLAAFLVNGEWDNRVLAVANYAVQGLCVAWIALFALSELRGRRAALMVAFALMPSVLVFDWENLVSGFQLQFQFVIFPSLIALTLIPNAAIGSAGSWAGVAAALFAVVSMGSGFLVLGAAVAGLLVRAWIERRLPLRVSMLMVALTLVAVVAWRTRAVFAAHDIFHAHTVGAWLAALLAYGAWPLPPVWWGVIALWAPWLLLVARMLRRRHGSPFKVFLVSFGVWLILQVLALAWGRAGLVPLVSARYAGMLAWSAVVAVASVAMLCAEPAATHPLRARLSAFAPVFAAVALATILVWRSREVYAPYLDTFVQQTHEHEARLAEFMRADDPSVFSSVDFPHTPYPVALRLVSLLRTPAIRDALPAPLQRERFRRSNPAALRGVRAGPLTHAARFGLQNGYTIAFAAALILGWACGFNGDEGESATSDEGR